MDDREFKFETRYSGAKSRTPYVVAGVAVALIIGIVVIMTTGVAQRILPMNELLFSALVPKAPDGSEALSLQQLQETSDRRTTLSVEGAVMNRTASPISGLQAVIEVKDRFSLVVQTVSVAVVPAELAPGASGTFQTMVMLGETGLGGYSVQFRLPDDGPFVPHRDERTSPPQLNISK